MAIGSSSYWSAIISSLIINLLVSRSSGIAIFGTINISANGRYFSTVIKRSSVKRLKNVLSSEYISRIIMTSYKTRTQILYRLNIRYLIKYLIYVLELILK